MKKVIALCMTLLAVQAWADVAAVNIWTAYPGKASKMWETAQAAKAIHEKLGATVVIAQDQEGNMHYVVTFKNWADYGKFADALGASQEWQKFWQQASVDPAAERAYTFTIDNPVVAESKPVSMVYSWDVDRGHTADFVAICQGAIPIHKRLGASPGINIDQLGNVHYELTFDSWEAWGNFEEKAATDEEWNAYLDKAGQNPIATLTKVWRINTVQ